MLCLGPSTLPARSALVFVSKLGQKSESKESNSRLVLPHKVGKLPVLRVELDDAYPVLDFL